MLLSRNAEPWRPNFLGSLSAPCLRSMRRGMSLSEAFGDEVPWPSGRNRLSARLLPQLNVSRSVRQSFASTVACGWPFRRRGDGARAGSLVCPVTAAHQLFPTVVQVEEQAAGGREGDQALQSTGHALRTRRCLVCMAARAHCREGSRSMTALTMLRVPVDLNALARAARQCADSP